MTSAVLWGPKRNSYDIKRQHFVRWSLASPLVPLYFFEYPRRGGNVKFDVRRDWQFE